MPIDALNYQYPEDIPHISGDRGNAALVVRKDTGATLADTDGDYTLLQVDATGNLRIVGTVTVSGGTVVDTNFDYPEDSLHVSGDQGAFILAVRNDAGTALAADGDYSPLQVNASGELRVTTAGGTPEDTPHVSGDRGTVILGVRNDVPSSFVDANGDYAPFAFDADGRLHVTVSTRFSTLGDTGTLNNGTQITVTNAATQLLAANTARAMLLVEVISGGPCRIGTTGVTTTTGFKLNVGASLTFGNPNCPNNAIFAIRDSGTDSVVLVQEVITP